MLGISEKLIFSNLRNALRPRKIYFDQFTHHFENPHRYQKVQNKILFHFLLVIHPCNNPPTQNRKKLKKSGSCTILRPNFSNLSYLD